MVGLYGQPLSLGPLGRVFRAGALTLKRGGRSLQLSRRNAPTCVFYINSMGDDLLIIIDGIDSMYSDCSDVADNEGVLNGYSEENFMPLVQF